MKILQKVAIISILVSLTSCVETIVVGSLATGSMVTREKSARDMKDDIWISAQIVTKYTGKGLNGFKNTVDVTVNEGRVLLTGVVRDPKKEELAVNLAWKVDGVREVINEIQLLEDPNYRPKNFSRATLDMILTLEIETKLLIKPQLRSTNYKINTVNGVVYLMGIAADEEELNKALDIVARVRGVRKVVNHIILSDDRRRG
ncbi:MAG: BON domain-containing protein [Rickettsiales bacterium]|nr:BON domain-containing protein [Rickettsiales bacterium]